MTEPRKSAPAAAKTPGPGADLTQILNTLAVNHSQLLGLLADSHGKAEAALGEIQALHAKLDALTVRANEAEKLLNSPGAKLAKGVAKVWNGLG